MTRSPGRSSTPSAEQAGIRHLHRRPGGPLLIVAAFLLNRREPVAA